MGVCDDEFLTSTMFLRGGIKPHVLYVKCLVEHATIQNVIYNAFASIRFEELAKKMVEADMHFLIHNTEKY